MQTLFLASAGVRFPAVKRELLNILPKDPCEMELAFVNTASRVVDDDVFAQEDEKELRNMGFNVTVIDITGMNEDSLREALEDVDIVFVEGGNSFYLLKQVRESGFESVVKDLIRKGMIYVGVSAGTYVVCPTIEMQTWKEDQDDYYGLTSLKAMSLVPFLISVHYNREKYQAATKEGVKNASLPVHVLTDDQALLVQDGEVTLVGDGDEVRID